MATPTYIVTPNKYIITEGESVVFTITTTNVANSTVLYWTNNGTTISGDLSNLSGSFNISNNIGTISLTGSSDVISEGTESIIISIRTGSITGPIVSTGYTVLLKDATPAASTASYSSYIGSGGASYVGSAGGSSGIAFNYSPYYERIANSLEIVALNSTAISSSLTTITTLATGSGIHMVGPYEWLNYASLYHLYVEQGKLDNLSNVSPADQATALALLQQYVDKIKSLPTSF